MALADLYGQKCDELKVPKCSSVAAQLGCAAGDLTSLDVGSARVGAAGLQPVIDVVKAAPNLEELNVEDNDLSSDAVQKLCKELQSHESLRKLNVSKNNLPLAGEALLDLVKANTKLVSLTLADTSIRPLFGKLIEYQLKKNAHAAKGKGSRGGGYTGGGAGAAAGAPPEEELDYGGAFGGFNFGGGGGGDDDDDQSGSNASDDDEEDAAAIAAMEAERKAMLLRVQAASPTGKGRRQTVSSEVFSLREIQSFRARKVEKTEADSRWLFQCLETVPLFSHLEDSELQVAIDAMTEIDRTSVGTTLVEEGQEGDNFTVIQTGTAEESRKGKVTRALKAGDVLCRTDLMYPSKHEIGVTVSSDDLKAWTLDRNTYRGIALQSAQKKRETYLGFLKTVNLLKHCDERELLQLADALKTSKFTQGQTIIEFGSVGDWFHIILEGIVDVFGRDPATGGEKHVCTFTVGENVGELEFINQHECVADVKARTPVVRTAKMHREHFTKVMGPMEEILRRTADTSEVYEYYRSVAPPSPTHKPKAGGAAGS